MYCRERKWNMEKKRRLCKATLLYRFSIFSSFLEIRNGKWTRQKNETKNENIPRIDLIWVIVSLKQKIIKFLYSIIGYRQIFFKTCTTEAYQNRWRFQVLRKIELYLVNFSDFFLFFLFFFSFLRNKNSFFQSSAQINAKIAFLLILGFYRDFWCLIWKN